MRFGPAYYDARQMQAALFKTVCDGNTSARDAAQCTKAWIDLERLKREMRGIPPLAAAKLKELYEHMQRIKEEAHAKWMEIGPTEIEEAPAKPTQPPSDAAKSTMQDFMPGSPGAKALMAMKSPARERKVFPPEKPLRFTRPYDD